MDLPWTLTVEDGRLEGRVVDRDMPPRASSLSRQQIALDSVSADNHDMDHRPPITASASALDIDDAQGSAAERPGPVRRIRRQGPPAERHLSLTRTLERVVSEASDPDEKARRVEATYSLRGH